MSAGRAPRPRQRGAAILLALLIMTLVATLAAGMVWLQWRGIEVETAERARGQAEWLLNASLDWGNLILKSSIRNGHKEDDLGQPWATPLAETKLSSFLSADGSHADDSGPEAYLSGQISDATSKYNLYNLVLPANGTPTVPGTIGRNSELQRLQILCTAIGVSPDIASTIAAGMRASYSAQQQLATTPDQPDTTNSVLMPIQVADLAWYGIDPKTIKMLEPFVQIIPVTDLTTPAPVNANTAPAEVLMAGCPVLTRAQAEQLILQRRQQPFDNPATVIANLKLQNNPAGCGDTSKGQPGNILAVMSSYFEIYGQLRYEQHVIRERSVVYRKDQFSPVQVLRRERIPPDAT